MCLKCIKKPMTYHIGEKKQNKTKKKTTVISNKYRPFQKERKKKKVCINCNATLCNVAYCIFSVNFKQFLQELVFLEKLDKTRTRLDGAFSNLV